MKYSRKYIRTLKKRLLGCTVSIATSLMLIAGGKLALLNTPVNTLASIKNYISTALSGDEINSINNENEIMQIAEIDDNDPSTWPVVECESIVQGVKEKTLSDGNYRFKITGRNSEGTEEIKEYNVELINVDDTDKHYTLEEGQEATTISLGDSSTIYKMLIVKYHGNLTIDKGVTLTATNVNNLTYKKGMYLCVMGDLKNYGTISMTARGTYNVEGENVYLWKNIDKSFEYIPAVGGAGIGARQPYYGTRVGIQGENGTARGTGGGGQGAAIINGQKGCATSYVGASMQGNSYSGGNASGAAIRCNTSALAASYTQASTTNGGNGSAYDSGSNTYYFAGGGAGNIAGSSSYCRLGTGNTQQKAETGTGGLLIIYTDDLTNQGSIVANGSAGAGASCNLPGSYRGAAGGGGSGGGSVNIFYNTKQSLGNITANGGNGGNVQNCTNANMGKYNGGNGGDGCVTLNQLKPDLNYTEKYLQLDINETYDINRNDISYINQNGIQALNIAVGDIEYSVIDNQIATVSTQGKITALKEGQTRIKITDTTNDTCTYIYVEVINNIKIDIQEGKNFTVALKRNGTVWSYGLNDNGQLGIGNNDSQMSPVQIQGLQDIKQIATGYSHALALTKNGEVYAWGFGENGQLGNGEQENSNVPIKIDGIPNIVKIDAYKNISIALDSEGKVYVWGEGNSVIPSKIVFADKVVDISGTLMLTEKSEVYDISDTLNPIPKLYCVAKISCGENHNLALSTNGIAFVWGTNTHGECGTATSGATSVTEIGYDMYNISAGNSTTMIQDGENNVYVLGNNANGELGLSNTASVAELTQINLSEEVDIKAISAGEGTHTGVIDNEGFVWHSGTNTNGELGIGDNTAQKSFIKTGDTIITIDNDDLIYLDLKEQVTITSKLENTFNLIIDVIDEDQSHFKIDLKDDGMLILNDKTITAQNYGETSITITHTQTGTTKEVQICVIMKMDSIVQGIRDCNLVDGKYTILVQGEIYKIELYNHEEDMRYSLDEVEDGEEPQTSKTVYLGDDTPDETMLVVKYHKNLTIDAGVTLTPTVRKKGMYICVLGDIDNSGEITMTARGANVEEGQDVYLWKNIDNSYEYVQKDGATGLEAYQPKKSVQGIKGNSGTGRQTGGGGQAGAILNQNNGAINSWVGSSTGGNSYAGGNGTGGVVRANTSALPASYTEASKTSGGNAHAYDANSNSSYFAGGGAGLLSGGTSSRARISTSLGDAKGSEGVGGLLIIYGNELRNNGDITAEGSAGAGGTFNFGYGYNGAVGGAGSGGGSINIFAKLVKEVGNISAAGGKGGKIVASRANMGAISGPDGGDGTVTINELGSVLNYPKKTINLQEKENYNIDKTKLSYTKLNEIQTEDITLGNVITFDTLNEDIATVDDSGNITAVAVGKTKIKITDQENGYSTYIIVNVTKAGLTTPQIKAGTDFTIALKANGTVWSFGKNENGQLGNNTQENSNEPVQVIMSNSEVLENIIDIGAGESSGIALNASGEVYTWGLNVRDVEEEIQQDEENDENTSSNVGSR